ncbi:MAG TPA: ATP-binding cassette domain-containing protein [Thermoanaerobaculia bacterium]|nr:ATP-binding cassette domain-containing protein [Thermoanaerobaculia bacterium]
MEPAIAFRDVSYGIRGKEVLRHFELEVAAGETLVLLGRSGSGKTTALKMVNALLTPVSGEVTVEGKPTREWDPILLRRRIGYVIQEAGLFPHYTVARNIAVVPELVGWERGRIEARVDELLSRVGLPPGEFRARYPRELSGGQRQRVGVARALAAEPSLLLMDEPFGALDPVTRRDLQREFVALRRSWTKTSLVVTHDVREALVLATRIALLHEGRLEIVATPREFLAQKTGEAQIFLAALEALPVT